MKQTAVLWVMDRLSTLNSLKELDGIDGIEYFHRLKEIEQKGLGMEKEQMNHIVDTNKMVSDKVLFEQATVAMEEHYGYDCETEIDAYFRGAKWMQKQFKQQD